MQKYNEVHHDHPLDECVCCKNRFTCDCFHKTVNKIEAAVAPELLPCEDFYEIRKKAMIKMEKTIIYILVAVSGGLFGAAIGYALQNIF